MTTVVNLRKGLDRKVWEPVTPAPVASLSGSFVISSLLTNRQMFVNGASAIYLNDPDEDATIQLPNSGLTGTFGAGSCGIHHPNGPTGTAIAGSTATTLNTALNLPGDLGIAGFTVRLTGGTGAGQERTVIDNTIGPNATLVVSTPWTVVPDATTTYLFRSGRYWVWNAGTASTYGFRYYDTATNTWSAELTKAPVGVTWGTDGRMVVGQTDRLTVERLATGGAASTLTDTTRAWAVNQWANMQVRINSGTGAGQFRTIASNTATVLTTTVAWTVLPDATSTYIIEGNDDHIYLLGNAAVAMYRYSISGNSWTTLAPVAARAGAPGSAMYAGLIWKSTDALWTAENAIINGRRIYSFRGGGTSALDYYDIASNTWVSGLAYLRQMETFTTGTAYALIDDVLYIQKEATGRWLRYDFSKARLDAWSTLIYPQGAVLAGDRAFDVSYTDGGTTIRWVCFWMNTGVPIFRCLII